MAVILQQQLVLAAAVAFLSVIAKVEGARCQPGVILPVWMPQDITRGELVMRGLAYFFALLYLFLGVSIVSDRFMGAIEVITSKEQEVKVVRPGGGAQIIVVRVWNETVANLTLMALGSSAPEILLSIIEITGRLAKGDFESGSGELGPGTIVGSAAFNLLIIIAICVYVIPDGEIRKIRHLGVFIVTAIWSVFAYVWLFLILYVITPGVVDIWEGLVTFFCFPLTVITAYMADRKILIRKYFNKSYRVGERRKTIIGSEGGDDGLKVFEEEEADAKIRDFEESRREYIGILRDLRKKFPNTNADELEALAREEIHMKGHHKSRAFYRLHATQKRLSGNHLLRKIRASVSVPAEDGYHEEHVDPFITSIFFDPAHYTVMESVGLFNVTVKRRGGDVDTVVMVDYKSEDGTANAGSDYKPLSGMLKFSPGEIEKTIPVEILEDEVFEEDEHFYIRLSNPRFSKKSTTRFFQKSKKTSGVFDVQLDNPFLATVMILDDDHAGIFNVNNKEIETVESIGMLEVQINRWSGARGKVSIDFATIDGTAKKGKEYEHVEGKLIFNEGQTEKVIRIPIIEEDTYEKDVVFFLQISNAVSLDDSGVPLNIDRRKSEEMTKEHLVAMEGWPKIGPDARANIRIRESKEFKDTIDKLLQKANASILAGTSSWKEQFIEAFTVNPDDDDSGSESGSGSEGEADEIEVLTNLPSMGDYVMHFLTLFWKVLFAFIPPTDICGGYLTFIVSIMGIGVLTAVIGDLAAHFGCTIHLKDSVTAITFVALGTSIPDTFASKVAAIQDQFADASIGNVTGSNAVNVFLGIGIAWTIAAVWYSFRICTPTTPDCNKFKVDPGSLAFSVTLFCTCAVIAISVILVRRLQVFGGGELGGPRRFKLPTTLLFVALWFFYIIMSSLDAYHAFHGF